MRILKFGAIGDDVRLLQQALNKSKVSKPIVVDGWFFQQTDTALRAYQSKKSLLVDGIAGYKTLSSLGLVQTSKVDWLVLHCSATLEHSAGINAAQIVYYHEKILGWGRPGYSRIIERSGKVEQTWTVNDSDGIQFWEMTYGVGNRQVDLNAINICYVGGLDSNGQVADTRTVAQRTSLEDVVTDLVIRHPNIKVAGHNQFFNKACPSFWVPTWLESIGIPERNIYKPDPFGYKKILK